MNENVKEVHDMLGFDGGFTVLMSVYRNDDPMLFAKAVDSVYSNTLLPNAMILIVDGPVTADLTHVIEKSKQQYNIHVFRLPSNCGLANALNEGMKHVDTEWIVRADADDYNHPDRFQKLSEIILKQPELSLVGSVIMEYERCGQVVAQRSVPLAHSDILKYIVKRNPFNHMTVAFRRTFAEKCGGYPNVYLKEDYALWASMINAGAKTANISDVLVDVTAGRDMYRRRGGIRYAQSEIALQKHLVKNNIKNAMCALIDGFVRASIFVMPNAIRGYIYEKYLRNNKI